ncbi:MAG: diguanylate cyclase [Ruminococcus sp.]|nr:diguanylate cyclase [Ruminococcus sp.]
MSGTDDIAVRTGGDEFVLIASGRLTDKDGQERIRAFERILSEKNAAKPDRVFDIMTSIGYVCFPASQKDALDEMIKEADRRIYEYKIARKKQRSS